jgi:hypothetical protein
MVITYLGENTKETKEDNLAAVEGMEADIDAVTKAEDAGHITGQKGFPAIVVRKNAAASLCDTDLDYTMLIVDTDGRLHVLDKNSADALTALQIIDDIKLNEEGTPGAAHAGVAPLAVHKASPACDAAVDKFSHLIVDPDGKLYTKDHFSGDVYSTPKTSTNTPARFAASAKKLRDVVLYNAGANPVDIGKYVNATAADLRAASLELGSGKSLGFTMVDLYKLALVASVDDAQAIIQVIGVEE